MSDSGVVLTAGQRDAIDSLAAIAKASRGALTVDIDRTVESSLDAPEYVKVRVWLSADSLPASDQGKWLEDWEPVDLLIYPDFPLTSPIAHSPRSEFEDLPHVAPGSGFCFYQSRNDWDPSAGMAGFIRQLVDVYARIATGTLAGHMYPWHPSNWYPAASRFIVRDDLPAEQQPASGVGLRWAVGIPGPDDRYDVVGWLPPANSAAGEDVADSVDLNGRLGALIVDPAGALVIPAVILGGPAAVEYRSSLSSLLFLLADAGVDTHDVLAALSAARRANQERPNQKDGQQDDSPDTKDFLLVRAHADTVGTTAEAGAHFAVAELPPEEVVRLSELLAAGGDAADLDWTLAPVRWAEAYDGSPTAMAARDPGRPVTRLRGARVLILGVGALGARMAEHCVRAGAASVLLVDSGRVTPGILARQPYMDADIGEFKAEALAGRLTGIRADVVVDGFFADVLGSELAELFDGTRPLLFDLVIDATANRAVAVGLERARRDHYADWPAHLTVAISREATHGVAAVSPAGCAAGGLDLLRRLGLETAGDPALGDVHEQFFPVHRPASFRPEPTCSDSTFAGSTTDVSVLAGQLLDSALSQLPAGDLGLATPGEPSLCIARLGRADGRSARAIIPCVPDVLVPASPGGYQVRLGHRALASMCDLVAGTPTAMDGETVTGGQLLGTLDDAVQIAWISRVTGPRGAAPDGSSLSPVGYWYATTGEQGSPPSDDARARVRELLAHGDGIRSKAVLLVLRIPPGGIPPSGGVPEPPPMLAAETIVTGSADVR